MRGDREARFGCLTDEVVRHAHRISGGTLVLGENAVCALAERIEAIARRAAPDRAQVKRLLAELEGGLRRFVD